MVEGCYLNHERMGYSLQLMHRNEDGTVKRNQ